MKLSPPTVRPARALAGSAGAAVLGLSALLPGLAHAQVASPPSVPAAVQVPPGNVRFLLGHTSAQPFIVGLVHLMRPRYEHFRSTI